MNRAFPEPGPATTHIAVHQGTTPTPEGMATLMVLRQAVARALDRKRRLGQYAVVWQNGQAIEIAADDLPLAV